MAGNENTHRSHYYDIPELTVLSADDVAASKSHAKVNYEKINRQLEEVKDRLNYDINPRHQIHLDRTKIAYHPERVAALRNGERVAPLSMDMAITQKCSYACTFCFAGLQYNKDSPADWNTYENFLDDCVEIGHKPGEGLKGITLTGDGENTENPHYHDFIMKGKANGIDMATATNGLKLDPDKMPELLSALTYLRFNVSGGEPEAYADIMGTTEANYHKTMENIAEAVRVKKENNLEVTLGLQMVLLPEYADQVIPMALLGRELGVDYTVIKHCSDDADGRLGVDYSWYKTKEATDLLMAAEALSTEDYSVQAKWSKLMTGKDRTYSKCFGAQLLFQASGTCLLAPCAILFHEGRKDYHLGNYAQERWRDIWAGPKYKQVMDHLGSNQFDPRKECASLCLQDKVNEVLFDLIENGQELPDVTGEEPPQHVNFV